MKKVFLLIFLLGIFVSCQETNGTVSTTKMELRQLVNKEITTKNSNGSFFVIMGGYSSSEQRQDIIKMFVKVDNSYYKLLKLNLEDVNVVIDNKVNKPYLIVTEQSNWEENDAQILHQIGYGDRIYLYCPEKYLPEKLLSIELN